MVKFILTVPDRLKSAVLSQMLAWRDEVGSDGSVEIRLVEKKERQDRVIAQHEPDLAEEAAAVPAQLVTVPALLAAASVQPDHSTKVYRVIDTAIPIGPVPHSVRMYLLDHPNSTCKQIIAATGRGQKSIESAIWMLRDRGIVKESVKA